MVSYEYFILVVLLIFTLSGFATIVFFALPPRKPFETLMSVSMIILILSLFVALGVGAVFSENSSSFDRIEKTYSDPVVSSTNLQLDSLKNTQYCLLKEGEEYRYFYSDSTEGDEAPNRINASQCEIRYGAKEPRLTIEETTRKYYMEWLFLYHYGSKTEIKYYFAIPSEESILDLDDP